MLPGFAWDLTDGSEEPSEERDVCKQTTSPCRLLLNALASTENTDKNFSYLYWSINITFFIIYFCLSICMTGFLFLNNVGLFGAAVMENIWSSCQSVQLLVGWIWEVKCAGFVLCAHQSHIKKEVKAENHCLWSVLFLSSHSKQHQLLFHLKIRFSKESRDISLKCRWFLIFLFFLSTETHLLPVLK